MTSSVTTTEIRDASGRRIAFCEYGDPTGHPVVVVHGSPGSRYEGLPLDNAAAAAGIRLIVPDRPGFGRTDPYMDKGFHSWDDDFVTLIDHLELDSATLMGFSGGGGYALAVAAAVPERVSKLVLACAMIPGAPRDTLRRRIKLVSALYFAANWAPRMAGAMLAGTGVFSKLRSDSVSIWPAADQAVMTDESHRPPSNWIHPKGSRRADPQGLSTWLGIATRCQAFSNPSRCQRFFCMEARMATYLSKSPAGHTR